MNFLKIPLLFFLFISISFPVFGSCKKGKMKGLKKGFSKKLSSPFAGFKRRISGLRGDSNISKGFLEIKEDQPPSKDLPSRIKESEQKVSSLSGRIKELEEDETKTKQAIEKMEKKRFGFFKKRKQREFGSRLSEIRKDIIGLSDEKMKENINLSFLRSEKRQKDFEEESAMRFQNENLEMYEVSRRLRELRKKTDKTEEEKIREDTLKKRQDELLMNIHKANSQKRKKEMIESESVKDFERYAKKFISRLTSQEAREERKNSGDTFDQSPGRREIFKVYLTEHIKSFDNIKKMPLDEVNRALSDIKRRHGNDFPPVERERYELLKSRQKDLEEESAIKTQTAFRGRQEYRKKDIEVEKTTKKLGLEVANIKTPRSKLNEKLGEHTLKPKDLDKTSIRKINKTKEDFHELVKKLEGFDVSSYASSKEMLRLIYGSAGVSSDDKRAYKKAYLFFHPDKNSAIIKSQSEEISKKLKTALDTTTAFREKLFDKFANNSSFYDKGIVPEIEKVNKKIKEDEDAKNKILSELESLKGMLNSLRQSSDIQQTKELISKKESELSKREEDLSKNRSWLGDLTAYKHVYNDFLLKKEAMRNEISEKKSKIKKEIEAKYNVNLRNLDLDNVNLLAENKELRNALNADPELKNLYNKYSLFLSRERLLDLRSDDDSYHYKIDPFIDNLTSKSASDEYKWVEGLPISNDLKEYLKERLDDVVNMPNEIKKMSASNVEHELRYSFMDTSNVEHELRYISMDKMVERGDYLSPFDQERYELLKSRQKELEKESATKIQSAFRGFRLRKMKKSIDEMGSLRKVSNELQKLREKTDKTEEEKIREKFLNNRYNLLVIKNIGSSEDIKISSDITDISYKLKYLRSLQDQSPGSLRDLSPEQSSKIKELTKILEDRKKVLKRREKEGTF